MEAKQLLIWDVDRPGHAQVTALEETREEFAKRISAGTHVFSLNVNQFTMISMQLHEGIKRREEQLDNLTWRTMSAWIERNWMAIGVLTCTQCKTRQVDYDAVRETTRLICRKCNDGYNPIVGEHLCLAPDNFPQPTVEFDYSD